jgi:hypothetical protein
MAKKGGSGKTYTSKGERKSSIGTKGVGVTPFEKMNRKMAAKEKGKRVVITVANPNAAETNKPFVRVMFDAKSPKGTILS